MAFTPTLYAQSVAWNGSTWDLHANGSLVRVDIDHAAEPLVESTGECAYPTFVALPKKRLSLKVFLRDLKLTQGLGAAKADLVCVVRTSSGPVTVTFAALVLTGVNVGRHASQYPVAILSFEHESADGLTVPLS